MKSYNAKAIKTIELQSLRKQKGWRTLIQNKILGELEILAFGKVPNSSKAKAKTAIYSLLKYNWFQNILI